MGAINAVAMDARGRIAVTGGTDGMGRIWDLGAGVCKHVLAGHGGTGLGNVPTGKLNCSIQQFVL